ncbi:gamma-glutamylcyclotransferase [Sulfitobacter albidus]|uniref:Gamma-glutamylcyclotransferase n=1 Tax=Sulfitobacter albidus TaxID=2829501 RepID=A0A975JDU6_9RHOB|nr:gamma-glutamylcyclotransferase family protein [Sulfitobacter albidus]QUJ76628.1 gamma-glutamylcyclotransferase [Sulfitobacter albidus]
MHPCFFGYGSLVNRDTHVYENAHRARLKGWRRAWVKTEGRDLAYLSVLPDAHTTIEGLIAEVPGGDWAALDAREHGYARLLSGSAVETDLDPRPDVSHYSVPPQTHVTTGPHGILLSYLDVVVQGYLREFGAAGVSRFFDTTDGWHTPVRNDRAAPHYPRAQRLSTQETALVDQHLALRGTPVTSL